MPFTGRLENRPLLDVIQIIAYSQQSGLLSVKGPSTKGLLVFESGNVVCAYSPLALPLLVKAAKERDEKNRLTFRRVQILAALRELFDVTEGDYRFVKKSDPVAELEGLDIRSFYLAGGLDTGDLLLVLQKAMDQEMEVYPARRNAAQEEAKYAGHRKYERYAPVVLKGRLTMRDRAFDGFLTNLSEGGTFFHADSLPSSSAPGMLAFDLPWDLGSCRVSCRIAWLRSEGLDAKRGAGLSFLQMEDETRKRILSYLSRFQQLAADVDFQA